MVSMMEQYHFSRFSNNRGYTCVALILFNCNDVPDLSFGEKVLLREYPTFIEGQHYVDSLYKAGEISSAIDLRACTPYRPGIYPLNGAESSSICVLSCDSEITTPLLINEIAKSKIPVQLLLMDTHRHSVLHAYSEGLFITDTITHFIRNIESEIDSRTLVIPHGIFMLQYSLQRALSGWNIYVASDKMADFPQCLGEIEMENS